MSAVKLLKEYQKWKKIKICYKMTKQDFNRALWQNGLKVKPKGYVKLQKVQAVDFENKLIYIYGQEIPLLPKQIEYINYYKS